MPSWHPFQIMARDPWSANPWPFAKKIAKTARENSGRRAAAKRPEPPQTVAGATGGEGEAVTAALDA
jgi:hypothetical protein